MAGLANKILGKNTGSIMSNSGSIVNLTCDFPAWSSITGPIQIRQWLMATKLLAKRGRLMNNDTTNPFGSLSGDNKWYGGVLAPNGCIYGIPYNSTTVLKIDPSTDTVSTFGSLSGDNKWMGGVLAPDGCIYGIPHNSTTVLKIDPSGIGGVTLNSDFCFAPTVNKF